MQGNHHMHENQHTSQKTIHCTAHTVCAIMNCHMLHNMHAGQDVSWHVQTLVISCLSSLHLPSGTFACYVCIQSHAQDVMLNGAPPVRNSTVLP